MTATQDAAQRAAVAKYIYDAARAYKQQAEAELKALLDPGDRKMAQIGDDQVATVSVSRRTETIIFNVTDEQALIRWVFVNEGGDGIESKLADWKRNELIARVEAGQELPDGIEPAVKQSGGTLSIRQTDTQKQTLLAHADTIRSYLAELTDQKGIEQ